MPNETNLKDCDDPDSLKENRENGEHARENDRFPKSLRTPPDSDVHSVRMNGLKYTTSYCTFPIQQPALSCVDKLVEDEKARSSSDCDSILLSLEPRVFAMEEVRCGKRRYISSHMGRFMDTYWRECNSETRHYYELIREGTPCRLYFDLEYNKETNSHIDKSQEEPLINELIAQISSEILDIFGIAISRSSVVDLDSSTSKKFSRHLLIHMRGDKSEHLFSDNIDCGVFVKNLVGRLAEEKGKGMLAKKSPLLDQFLFVNTNSESQTCFLDLGVYTRNRLFRLMGSKKYGKPSSAILRIASSCDFLFPESFCNELFYTSEEAGSVKVSDIADVPCKKECRENNTIWEFCAIALSMTLVVPIGHRDERKFQLLPKQYNGPKEKQHFSLGYDRKVERSKKSIVASSPFPILDKFVTNVLANRQGVQGSFRSCYLEGNDLSNSYITYNMAGNRWCENVKRCHKSNNIIWNVSVKEMQYWQSCHDPECQLMRFQGRVNELPNDVRDGINDILLNKAVQVDEQFENALMTLNFSSKKEKKRCAQKSMKTEDDFDLDEDFLSALMKLDLSAGDPSCNQNNSKTASTEEAKESNLLEESFDAGFGLALVSALKEDPGFCP